MKLNVLKLDHVQVCIPAGEEDKARSFYGELLGLAEIEKPQSLKKNGGLWYAVGDIQLHIGTDGVVEKSKAHPAFEITMLAETKRYLKQNGVQIKEEIKIPGVERFSFRDPFGNRIELLSRN
ncbi:MAG TPA: VOC family protein [Bacillales bacterium]|nr:VOC family protein [Bacillales bacterium]